MESEFHPGSRKTGIAGFRDHLWSNSCLTRSGGEAMLWTIFVVLLVLWLLGMVSSYTLGGFLHLLLILAVAILLIRVIQGRPAV
jgi:hypothetical protein